MVGWIQRWQVLRLSSLRYWQRRASRLKRQRSRARLGAEVRGQVVESRGALRATRLLLTSSLGPVLAVSSGLALIEFLAFLAREAEWIPFAEVFEIPSRSSDETVSTFVGSGVAVAATLLGLYYATVGVVASTVYKDVPGELRTLFVRERNGEIYIRLLVLTLAGGLVVLVARALNYSISGLTLVVLAVMAVLTSIWLMVLGSRLFGFFDPSLLSRTLPPRIDAAIREASEPASRGDETRQRNSYYRAYTGLVAYRQIVELVDRATFRSATAPIALTRQLFGLLGRYSAVKNAIPTASHWWARTPKHQNWLTIDSTRREIAMNASVGFPPEEAPDYYWFENEAAALLQRTLAASVRANGGADALAIADEVGQLVANLAARLQIRETLIVESAWGEAVAALSRAKDGGATEADRHAAHLNQMAAAENLVLPLTRMWLGLVFAAQSLKSRDLSAEFDLAIKDPAALYRAALPPATRQMLEQFALAIKRETKAEGRRVTPSWWVDHYVARSLADAFLATEAGILDAVRARTFDRIAEFRTEGREDLAVVIGMASLELMHKIEIHTDSVKAAITALEEMRNRNTANDLWPSRVERPTSAAADRRELLATLASSLPALRKARFDPEEPDLYGQLFQFVFEAAFDAILEGSKSDALPLYNAVFDEMEPARQRLTVDLENHELQARAIYSVEPVVGAMELAGYALLMNELDGDGIWNDVRALWDDFMKERPQAPLLLTAAVQIVDGIYAMTAGGIERSRRSIVLDRLFADRGIRKEQRSWATAEAQRPHESSIVSAFAPLDFGIHNDLYHLFAVEYLIGHLPVGHDLGHQVKSLAAEIQRYRDEASKAAPKPEPTATRRSKRDERTPKDD